MNDERKARYIAAAEVLRKWLNEDGAYDFVIEELLKRPDDRIQLNKELTRLREENEKLTEANKWLMLARDSLAEAQERIKKLEAVAEAAKEAFEVSCCYSVCFSEEGMHQPLLSLGQALAALDAPNPGTNEPDFGTEEK